MSRARAHIRAANARITRLQYRLPLQERLRMASPCRAVGIAVHVRRRGNEDMRRDLERDMQFIETRAGVRRAGRVAARHLRMLMDQWLADGLSSARISRRLRNLSWFFLCMGRPRLVPDFRRTLTGLGTTNRKEG